MVRYVGTVYRPPSEAGSLLIQATIGCPHNRCRFCGMYKGKRFKIRPTREIIEDLDEARRSYGENVRTLFLPDGNTIIMKTASLVKILERARENFSKLERITLYGSARFIVLKTPEELAALQKAGLTRLHMGLESGDDVTLEMIDKGADAETSIEAGRKIKAAGIQLSAYYLVGIGGRDRIEQHALNSARALNAMNPDFIRLRTYMPVKNAPIYQDIQSGRFTLPTPHEAMRELRLLIEGLETTGVLVSDHISNYVNLSGRLPEDKQDLLKEIDLALSRDENAYHRQHVYL